MNTLREIRHRLNSIKSIQQLTRAMEMVAASRLYQAHDQAKKSQPYISKIEEMMSQLSLISSDFNHPFFIQQEAKTIGLVVIGSDMGLCGSYNKDVITATNHFLNQHSSSSIKLILLGRKAINYYRRRERPIHFQWLEWSKKINQVQIKALTHQLIEGFLTNEMNEIWFVYTHYHSMTSRKVVTKKFLNIDPPSKDSAITSYLFEPSLIEVYQEVLSRYFLTFVQTALNEAHASELAARIFAMKAATTNANDMIEKLTLVRNKFRQADITREMIEITSGIKD